jgi:hypothetical protein
MDIFYLDADEWTDNPLDGNTELYTDDTHVTTDLVFFDEIIDIPATLAQDAVSGGEAYLIALIKDPRTVVGGAVTAQRVTLYSLNVELLPEDSSLASGLEDRAIRGFLQHTGGGSPLVGGTQTLMNHHHALRYPIYRQVIYPLVVTNPYTGPAGAAEITDVDNLRSFIITGDAVWVDNRWMFNQPHIPVGSIVLRMAINVLAYFSDGEIFDAKMEDAQSYLPDASFGEVELGVFDPLTDGIAPQSTFPGVHVGIGHTNFDSSGVRLPERNRIGFPHGSFSGIGTSFIGGSQLIFNLKVQSTPGAGFLLQMTTGYIIAWVDPRLDGVMIEYVP